MMQMFGEGKYHIIPSFFRTLIFLKKAKREFAIVFRTFGSDIDNVVFEFNKFCNGVHPCYSGSGGAVPVKFDGSKGTKDLRIKDKHQNGLNYRYGEDIKQTTMVTGTLKRVIAKPDELAAEYDSMIDDGSIHLYQDPIDQYIAILEMLKKNSSMAIQDDYNYWKSTDFERRGGKLLLLDQADYHTQHIFFDDNAEEYASYHLLSICRDEKCNVDVKDVITGQSVPYSKFINKYVVKVEPHRAILELDYFIKQIEMAEQRREEEIHLSEQGIIDSDGNPISGNMQQDEESEWQRIQSMTNEEYL